VPGPFPRPGLVRDPDGPPDGIEIEVWDLPEAGLGGLLPTIAAPLALGPVRLDDGSTVPGFVATTLDGSERDITGFGGWRAWLAARAEWV
jgi:allophanate hydrolase